MQEHLPNNYILNGISIRKHKPFALTASPDWEEVLFIQDLFIVLKKLQAFTRAKSLT